MQGSEKVTMRGTPVGKPVALMLACLAFAWLAKTPLSAQDSAGALARPSGERFTAVNPVDEQASKGLPSIGGSAGVDLADSREVGAPDGSAVNVAIPELPAGKTISIFFDVTVNSPVPRRSDRSGEPGHGERWELSRPC